MKGRLVETDQWIEETIFKIREKMAWVSEKNKNKIPYTTDANGNYDDRSIKNDAWGPDEGLCWWTNGFWGGMMWLLYQDTKDERYADYAKLSEAKLEKCFNLYEGLHHDVGFMFMPTAVMDYRLTKNPNSRKIGMHAASLLAGRFNPAGNFIRAWNDNTEDNKGKAIIDCMMNLSLLYWASEESKDPRFKNIAVRHAAMVKSQFVRTDGSVSHIVIFDPETGARKGSIAGQGYAEDSAWTRGQGWGIYGFMVSYIHTGEKEYLETARKIADYCISKLPENGFIPIDFVQPPKPQWEDSCGACIIASGLLELVKGLPKEEGKIYQEAAIKILKAIKDCRTNWTRECDGIVENCSTAYHWGEKYIYMSYADYFFMEAIYKLKGIGRFIW